MKRISLVVTLMASLFTPLFLQVGSAVAQDELEARSLFEAGRIAFADGRFEEALHHFGRSYELSGRHSLLYNMGSTQEKMGWRAEAVESYKSYLEKVPDAPNKNYVSRRIGILEREIAAQKVDDSKDGELEEDEDEGEVIVEDSVELIPTEPVPEPKRSIGAPLALFAVAGAAGIGGIVTGIMANSAASDLNDRCADGVCGPQDAAARADLESQLNRKNTLALVTDILLGVSLVSAATAVILLVTGGKTKEESPAVSATCHSRGCRADFSMQF